MVEQNIKPVITIEDHPDIQDGLKKLMIECGLDESQLFFTQNPTEARKVLKDIPTPPGLILIDIGVSNRNEGFSFLDWVKAEESPLKEIPVIVISADAREDTRKAAVEKGASEFIGQPFELNVMMTAVKKHLGMEK